MRRTHNTQDQYLQILRKPHTAHSTQQSRRQKNLFRASHETKYDNNMNKMFFQIPYKRFGLSISSVGSWQLWLAGWLVGHYCTFHAFIWKLFGARLSNGFFFLVWKSKRKAQNEIQDFIKSNGFAHKISQTNYVDDKNDNN